MSSFFQKVFNVRSGELSLVLLMSFLLLANTAARQMSGIVGIASVINIGGANQTLLVNAINGVVILITAALASLIVDRYNRVQLLRWTTFGFAMAFLVLRMIAYTSVPPQVNAALLYIMSQQQWLVFPMFFWVLANDIFELAQAKRLIPVISSWSFIGKVLGIGLTIAIRLLFQAGLLSIPALDVEMALTINIFTYLVCFLLISIGMRKIQLRDTGQEHETLGASLTEGWDFVKEVPAFRYLMLAVTAILVCDVILEFRFFVVTKSFIPDKAEYQQFYGWALLAAAIVSYLIQSFVTGRVISRLQLRNTFLIQPTNVIVTSAAMLFGSIFVVAVGVWSVLKIFRNTIDEASQKAFQGLIPEERRGRVALFMDNYAPAVGTLAGSLIAGAVVFVGELMGSKDYHYVYLGVAVVVGCYALWNILQMRKVYDTSLFNWRLKRRKRGVDVLSKLDFDD